LLQPYVVARELKGVAQRAGVTQNWLSKRKNGVAAITADDVYLLAKGLQCDPCDFFASEVEARPIPSREDREAPFTPSQQAIYDDLKRLLADTLEPPAAAAASTIVDFLQWQQEKQQRDQQQQWQRRVEQPSVSGDTPERG
jgi:transcriptional regulator with XRE-family HTH domain